MGIYGEVKKAVAQLTALGLPQGPHITRYSMYERLRSVGRRLQSRGGRVLSISGSEELVATLGLTPSELVAADYPTHNMLALGFPDSSFDYVVSDQVLEHVEGNPQRAIDECRRVLRPGGVAVHTTCFVNPVHGMPKDFWRFSQDALALLHEGWSEILEVGGWGNPEVWIVARCGLRFVGVPHAEWHPLHRLAVKNDPLWPIVTWVVARK